MITERELPVFWDRETIFFANLRELFFGNIELTRILEHEIRGITTYGGRLVPIINILFQGNKNLIFLESMPDEYLLEYMVSKSGISLPDIKVLPRAHYPLLFSKEHGGENKEIDSFSHTIQTHPARWIDGFVTDETLVHIAQESGKSTISSFNGSKDGNNKYLLYRHTLEKGLPVFDTCVATSSSDTSACFNELKERGYEKVVLKSQIGASGCGMIIHNVGMCTKKDFPDYLFFEGPCLIQGWLGEELSNVKHIGSPSVQMFIHDHALVLYDITEQLLSDKNIHEGNISPPPYLQRRPHIKEELLAQASEAGTWLHSNGYRGTAGVDFLVVERSQKPVVIITEINARITGATYPAVLARYFLPESAWLMRNMRFSPAQKSVNILSILSKNGLLFEQGMETAVFPINFNVDNSQRVNKGQFLFLAPDTDTCITLLKKAQALFPGGAGFDRD